MGTMMTLPEGWKIVPFKKAFEYEILTVAAGFSGDYTTARIEAMRPRTPRSHCPPLREPLPSEMTPKE